MGRKSTEPRLFKSIKPQNQMMQNLLDIENRTGGAGWLGKLDEELTRQGRTARVSEGKTFGQKYIREPIEALIELPQKLFGRTPARTETMGTTSAFPGLFNQSDVNITADPKFFEPKSSKSLQGRNPYVQSLIDTVRHELGGHVMENITPEHRPFAGDVSESAAQGMIGESAPTARSEEVRKYMNLTQQDLSNKRWDY